MYTLVFDQAMRCREKLKKNVCSNTSDWMEWKKLSRYELPIWFFHTHPHKL